MARLFKRVSTACETDKQARARGRMEGERFVNENEAHGSGAPPASRFALAPMTISGPSTTFVYTHTGLPWHYIPPKISDALQSTNNFSQSRSALLRRWSTHATSTLPLAASRARTASSRGTPSAMTLAMLSSGKAADACCVGAGAAVGVGVDVEPGPAPPSVLPEPGNGGLSAALLLLAAAAPGLAPA